MQLFGLNFWKIVIIVHKIGKPLNYKKNTYIYFTVPNYFKILGKAIPQKIQTTDRKKTSYYHHTESHRITGIIEQALEENQVCSTVFLDIVHTFVKVWHEGQIYKLKKMLPKQYVDILIVIS